MSKKRKLLDNLWKYSSIIVLINLIWTIPMYAVVVSFENNHPIEDDSIQISADSLSSKRTRIIKNYESLSYDVYVIGANFTDLTIFLVAFSVYQEYDFDFATLFDYWEYLYLGVNKTNCILVKGMANNRHSYNTNIKLNPVEEYVFLFFNFEEEMLEVDIEFQIINKHIKRCRWVLDVLLVSFGASAPVIAILLAINQLIEYREKTSKISLDNKEISVKLVDEEKG